MRAMRALVLRTFCGDGNPGYQRGSWAANYRILIRTEAGLQSEFLSREDGDGI